MITLLVVVIATVFHVILRHVFFWYFFHLTQAVQNFVHCLYDIFMWVNLEMAFDPSYNLVDPFDDIITNYNFRILNIVKFEILKAAIIICALNENLNIWVFKNLTIIKKFVFNIV